MNAAPAPSAVLFPNSPFLAPFQATTNESEHTLHTPRSTTTIGSKTAAVSFVVDKTTSSASTTVVRKKQQSKHTSMRDRRGRRAGRRGMKQGRTMRMIEDDDNDDVVMMVIADSNDYSDNKNGNAGQPHNSAVVNAHKCLSLSKRKVMGSSSIMKRQCKTVVSKKKNRLVAICAGAPATGWKSKQLATEKRRRVKQQKRRAPGKRANSSAAQVVLPEECAFRRLSILDSL